MLRESLLKFTYSQGTIVPHFLDERDYPWIRRLVDEFSKFVGSRKSELDAHLKGPLPVLAPRHKVGLAAIVLSGIFRSEIKSKVKPRILRRAAFSESAKTAATRFEVLKRVGERFDLRPDEVETCLFLDLPNERRIASPPELPSPSEIALKANSLLVQGFLARTTALQIDLSSNARIVIRQAKLKGLICVIEKPTQDRTRITVSGPYSLFRRTQLYGKALGSLVPILSWSSNFTAVAQCILREKELPLILKSGDPIFPSKMPKQFDSKVEERFARAFARATKDWNIEREPEPVQVGHALIYPDFVIKNGTSPDIQWWLEIVGFWMPDYLERKLEKLRAANLSNFILCIDDSLKCADEDFPRTAQIIRFRRSIDPQEILRILERKDG